MRKLITKSNGFRGDIQGLRAIAIICVLIAHFQLGMPGGFVGVDIFFVISGFLITQHLIHQQIEHGRISLKMFFAKRLSRIVPAALSTLLFTLIALAVVLPQATISLYVEQAFYVLFSVVNYYFAFESVDYFGSDVGKSPFLHYWSLAVEEQFYLFWPFIIMLVFKCVGKQQVKKVLVSCLLCTVLLGLYASYEVTSFKPSMAYFGIHIRFWELALGGLVASLSSNIHGVSVHWLRLMSVTGAGGLIASFSIINNSTPFPSLWALLPTLSTALLIAGGMNSRDSITQFILENRFAQYIGNISYSLYLVHWPIYIVPTIYMGEDIQGFAKLAFLFLCIVCAHLQCKIIEDKLRLREQPQKLRRVFAGYGVAFLVCTVLLAVTYIWSSGVVHSVEAVSLEPTDSITLDTKNEYTESVHKERMKQSLQVNELSPRLEAQLSSHQYSDLARRPHDCFSGRSAQVVECQLGSAGAEKNILVYGDSYAHHWLPAFDIIGKKDDIQFSALTRSVCPSLLGEQVVNDANESIDCITWQERALARIKEEQPEAIILSFIYRPHLNFERAEPFLSKLKKITPNIIWLHSGHRVGSKDWPGCVLINRDAIQKCSSFEINPRQQRLNYAFLKFRGKLENHNIHVVDVTDLLCINEKCPAVINDILVYRDRSHLSAFYVEHIAALIGDRLSL